MILELRRRVYGPDYTIGDLYIEDKLFCQVVEDKDRGLMFQMPLSEIEAKKIHGKTAIPTGVYPIVFSYSPRFKKLLPLLLNVPGFSGIRIHPGNTASDTEGCLLPGVEVTGGVKDSRNTFNALYALLNKASKKEKIIIFITNHDH